MAELPGTTAEPTSGEAAAATTRRRSRTSATDRSLNVADFQVARDGAGRGDQEMRALEAEVAALAAQLQDARERQKTLSATLENVLDSTGIATVVLDAENRIRFFTPATRSLFNMLPGDIGRPVFDLASHTPDPMLADDIATVCRGGTCEDRQLRASDGTWFNRRVQPFRTHDNRINGVVITYLDVTDRKNAEQAVAQARAAADAAGQASARFLSAASHDLRQPLQTLMLLQELLAGKAQDPELQRLVGRLDLALDAMASLLDGLRDRSRLEAGAVDIAMSSFVLGDLLAEVAHDVAALAQTARLELRHVPTRLVVRSDRRLLGAMIRNLVTSSLKTTVKGGVLIGARRRGNSVRIEVWDTGAGIPADQQAAILAAEPGAGAGVALGLAVVRNMAAMLDHPIALSSRTGDGHGTMFAITVPLEAVASPADDHGTAGAALATPSVTARILLIDDDAEVLAVMTELLRANGHNVVTARDETEAVAALSIATPDLIIADYRLLDRDGLELVDDLRARLLALHQRRVPAIMLTGDTSAEVVSRLAERDVQRLAKPVRQADLVSAITVALKQAGLPLADPQAGDNGDEAATSAAAEIVHIIDDDPDVREQLGLLLADAGLKVQLHASSAAFRANWQPGTDGCLLIDAMMPGETGLDLLRSLKSAGTLPPAIMITGQGDVAMAVAAMKAGAVDFIEKPASSAVIIASIKRALASRTRADDGISEERRAAAAAAAARLVSLTPRQREVMAMVLDGHPSKNIAADLKLSQRTVENHRAEIMHRSGCKSLPELARLVMIAQSGGAVLT